MIRIEALRKSYGKIEALRGVSLGIHSGRITGVVGPNACGKTTLIKSILGLVLPDSGRILVNGQQVAADGAYRGSIGYLPQNPDFPQNLTIRELFAMIEDLRGVAAPLKDELLALFELEPSLDRPFGVLSGGTKQKVGAVLAFMYRPGTLILDEPTVGLDPLAVTRLKGLITRAAAGGAAVLFVSHIMSEVEGLVDEMIFMLEGTVLFSGTIQEIIHKASATHLEEAIVRLLTAKGEPARPGAVLQ